ncbi:MAG: hypothetical protein HY527_23005 [Betaproteobacteria bacterium]|nr:hypothetical protein [Betaproteobacteria bacterium]
MTPGVEHALGAMLFYGLTDLVYKRAAAAGVPARHFLMVQVWCFAPAIVLYGFATGTLEAGTAMLWGTGAGLFIFVALYNFARSLAGGEASVLVPIAQMSFVVTAALGLVILREPFTARKAAGLAFAAAALAFLAKS